MKSDYLENLPVAPNMYVVCKCDMHGNFTPGKRYAVQFIEGKPCLENDKGDVVIPSGRFYPTSTGKPFSEWGPWRQYSSDNL